MSNQAVPLVTLLTATQPCCPPIAEQRLDAGTASMLATAFKALGDPVRLRLMSMIATAPAEGACVCDLTPAFDLSGPTISHHLKVLREAGLVSARRQGTWVYYQAHRGVLAQLAALLTVPRDDAAGGPGAGGHPAEASGTGA